MMVTTLLRPSADDIRLSTGEALAFVDVATGAPILDGLSCNLVLRRDGQLLGRARATPSGVHHWPELAARWRQAAPGQADVFVRDDAGRFLPLSLPWPLPAAPAGQVTGITTRGATRLLQVELFSAPGRAAPPGQASIHGLLTWQADEATVPWAHVRFVDGAGRMVDGASDAYGRLTLHLPRPRPDKAGSPPEPAAQLRVFAGAAMVGLAVPDALGFAAQPEVRALASSGQDDAYVPAPFQTGEPLILTTAGLPSLLRQLRLKPL
jgi:hypothetical protein